MTRSGSSSGARECADGGRAILDPDDEALWLDPGCVAPVLRPRLFEKFPLRLLILREAAVSSVAQVVNARIGAPYDKLLRLRRSVLTHVPTICRVRLAVVHAVACLFGHTRLLSLSSSPQLDLKSSRRARGPAAPSTLAAMCGRFTQTAAFDVLAERFGITIDTGTNEELTARYNVAPSQAVPIITASEKGRRLVMAKWGFRPAWVNDAKLAPINARAETISMSRLFGAAVRDWRCLVPATGFYELKPVRGQKGKQPYFVRLKGGAPFAFAGLWIGSSDADSPLTCTIITTTANELLTPIHPRMPVILDSDDEALWLDPGCIAPIKVLPCLRPFPSERMEAIPVSSLVSSPNNEGPELIEPVLA